MENITEAVIVFCVIALGILSCSVLAELLNVKNRIKKLEDESGTPRHTRSTSEGIDDANAVAVETIIRMQEASLIAEARLKQLTKILGDTRVSPRSYQSGPSRREEAEADARARMVDMLLGVIDHYEGENNNRKLQR